MATKTVVSPAQAWVNDTRQYLKTSVESGELAQSGVVQSDHEKAPIKDLAKWKKEILDPAQAKFYEKMLAAKNTAIEKGKEKVKASKVAGAETLVEKVIGSKFDDLYFDFGADGMKAPEKLDLVAHVKNFEARLLLLEKTALELVNDPGQFETVLQKGAEDKEKAEKERAESEENLRVQAEKDKLDKARKAANTRLVELGPVPEAKQLKSDLIAAKTTGEVETVDEKITKALKDSKKTVTEGYASSLKEVEKEINAKKLELAKNKSALAALDGILLQFKQAEVLAKTGNPAALEGIKAIAARLKELTDTAAKSGGALDLVFKKIDEVDKKLGDKDLKTEFEAEFNELTLASKDLRAAVDPFELGKAQTSANELAVKVDALAMKGDQLKTWREATKKTLNTLNDRAGALRDLHKKRGVFGSLTGAIKDKVLGAETGMTLELKALEEEYEKPGADPVALGVRLDKLKAKVNEALSSLDEDHNMTPATKVLLDKDEQEGEDLLKERKEKAEALTKWKTKYENFLKEVKVVETAVMEANGEKEDVEIIRSIAKMALGKREADDIEGADSQYTEAEKRLAELKAHPAGFTMKSSEEIANTKQLWVDALLDFDGKIGKIKEAAREAAGEKGNEVAALIVNSMEIFMEKNIFTADAAILGNPAAKPAERKKARERILRQVRVYQAALKTNPMLELVRRNPFKVTQVTGGIVTFLSSLELNALRAIRAE